MNGVEGIGELEPDARDFLFGEMAGAGELAVEADSADEFHPQACASVDAFGAVDPHDIWMTDAGQEVGFTHERPFVAVALEEFERHLAIEAGVEGTIDLAVGTRADVFEDDERPPARRGVQRIRRRCGPGGRVQPNEPLDGFELPQQPLLVRGCGPRELSPVDGVSVGNPTGRAHQI